MTDAPCPFCEIVAGQAPAEIVHQKDSPPGVMVIVPLKPVTQGHLLVIPHKHVTDFSDDPPVSAYTMECAAWFARQFDGDFNLITSRGPSATQSVRHLHLHLVPRRANDGLSLPWHSGEESVYPDITGWFAQREDEKWDWVIVGSPTEDRQKALARMRRSEAENKNLRHRLVKEIRRYTDDTEDRT